MSQHETEMSAHIFAATARLMAAGGLQNLSMHKIAKEAKISPGTIYIHFKSKEDLLEQFALHIFNTFNLNLLKGVDQNLPFFEQYRQMWWNIWQFLQKNPDIVLNMHQYQALPGFCDTCEREKENSGWHQFCLNGQEAGVICDLPSDILFSFGLRNALDLAFDCAYFKKNLEADVLEVIIERTWRSIKK